MTRHTATLTFANWVNKLRMKTGIAFLKSKKPNKIPRTEGVKRKDPVVRQLIGLCWFPGVTLSLSSAADSNKEHAWLCVILTLPAHLSTMLRRTPPQMSPPQLLPPFHFPLFSHTLLGSPPWACPPSKCTHSFHISSFPCSRDDLKPITLISAQSHLKLLQQKAPFYFLTGQAEKNQKTNLARCKRDEGGVCVCVCVCLCVMRKVFSQWFMSLSRLGYESGMMLQRAALHLMLAHLKRADLCSLSGLTSIPPVLLLLLLLLLRPLRSEKLVVIIDHRYCSNLVWKMN